MGPPAGLEGTHAWDSAVSARGRLQTDEVVVVREPVPLNAQAAPCFANSVGV